MNPINYLTNITLGLGSVAVIPQVLGDLGMRRPLIVTDSGVAQTPAFDKVTQSVGRSLSVFAETPANPTEEAADQGLALFRAKECDGILAVGGGSAIDLAKAVALLATHDGPLSRYALILGGLSRITPSVAPVVAVPTTAGTGSEVGRGALITLRDGRKLGFISQYLIPRHAVCDPELTLTLPARLTAATGMDALAHCIETFLSPRDNPVAEAIALDGAGRVMRSLEPAVRDASDKAARYDMMTAALMGGLCFQKGLGAVHSLSHGLGALRQPSLHHGTLNAILLPPVLRANAPYVANKYERLLEAMRLPAGADIAVEIENLNARLGIPKTLREIGVTDQIIPGVVEAALADHSHATNPFQPTPQQYELMLRSVM